MRNAFAAAITELAAEEKRLVLLSGDIGNRLFDTFKARFPDRFYNCGVAEANMVSVAAGLAMSGLLPVTYTIAAFATIRCLEQIRVDVCYHDLPVIIVGTGAGLSYAELGGTHHACEDIACLRALPNMSVVCPGDPTEVRLALRAGVRRAKPLYVRIGKKGEPDVHATPPAFELGKGIVVREGERVCLISTGTVLPVAMAAAQRLEAAGRSARVVSLHTVKPLDTALLEECFARFSVVVTVEEHSELGGLGSSVGEWLAKGPPRRALFRSAATPDAFVHGAEDQDDARAACRLTAQGLADLVMAEDAPDC